MRFIVALLSLGLAVSSFGQSVQLPEARQPAGASAPSSEADSTSAELAWPDELAFAPDLGQKAADAAGAYRSAQSPKAGVDVPLDAKGNPIPLERVEPQRILGFMPNFRSVSGGAIPHPPGWRYNFTVATHQATDYSSFIFLGITSLTAEATNAHPVLGKGVGGLYAYTWRGFLDKSDNTYLSAWLLSSLLHEDTRYFALGAGHSIAVRTLYVISRQAVARTYGGRQTPNFAGLGAKVLTQVVSRTYYPPSATSFNVLATKFSYSVMRDVAFSSIREFYPDGRAYFIKRHREKMARLAEEQVPVQPDGK